MIIDISTFDRTFINCVMLLTCILSGCAMPLRNSQPNAVYTTEKLSFSNIVIHDNTIYSAGIVGWDKQHRFVGTGDFECQLNQTLHNIKKLLNHAGSNLDHVIGYRFYVKALNEKRLMHIKSFLANHYNTGYKPVTTVIGVASLAVPELEIEIEFIAKQINKRPKK